MFVYLREVRKRRSRKAFQETQGRERLRRDRRPEYKCPNTPVCIWGVCIRARGTTFPIPLPRTTQRKESVYSLRKKRAWIRAQQESASKGFQKYDRPRRKSRSPERSGPRWCRVSRMRPSPKASGRRPPCFRGWCPEMLYGTDSFHYVVMVEKQA